MIATPLADIICTIAVNFGTKSVRVSDSLYFFELACEVVILCLYICESVDSGDDLSCVFSKTVQDNTKRFFTNFCLLSLRYR